MAAGENPQFPISSHDADAVIAGVKAAFLAQHGAAIPFRIEKVRVMADLPAALQASAACQEVGESGRGAFYNNTIYVVQNAHSPPAVGNGDFPRIIRPRCVAFPLDSR